MERNRRKKLIIEFNGLPGTGKSTICSKLENYFIAEGYSTIRQFYKTENQSVQSMIFHPKWGYVFIRLFLSSMFVRPLRCRIHGIVSIVKYARMYIEFSRHSRDTVLITDEGLVQAFLSFFHIDSINDNCFLSHLVEFICGICVNFVRVDCYNDAKTVSQRIIGRGNTGARLDSFEETDLLDALNVQNHNLSIIREAFSNYSHFQQVITVDTNNVPSSNAQFIFESVSHK